MVSNGCRKRTSPSRLAEPIREWRTDHHAHRPSSAFPRSYRWVRCPSSCHCETSNCGCPSPSVHPGTDHCSIGSRGRFGRSSRAWDDGGSRPSARRRRPVRQARLGNPQRRGHHRRRASSPDLPDGLLLELKGVLPSAARLVHFHDPCPGFPGLSNELRISRVTSHNCGNSSPNRPIPNSRATTLSCTGIDQLSLRRWMTLRGVAPSCGRASESSRRVELSPACHACRSEAH